MTETTRYETWMGDHPDLLEMRERYERLSASGPTVVTDGLALLAGLWLAISPWVVHFAGTAPKIRVNNLVLGVAVAAMALAMTMVPQRMAHLSWATAAVGIWVVVSPWVIWQSAVTTGIVLTNVITGGVIALLGVAAAAILMRSRRGRPGHRTS